VGLLIDMFTRYAWRIPGGGDELGPDRSGEERADLLKHSVDVQVEKGHCSQLLLSVAQGIAA
jgi:hypothetical protein